MTYTYYVRFAYYRSKPFLTISQQILERNVELLRSETQFGALVPHFLVSCLRLQNYNRATQSFCVAVIFFGIILECCDFEELYKCISQIK